MKVIEKLSNADRAALTPLELRKQAKAFAMGQIEVQKKEFRRWGVLGEWDKPYLTLNPEYEAQQIGVFANMVKKGLIYRDFKPVYWSPSSRTALAEAELEYRNDHVSPSVYVLFELKELPNLHPDLFGIFSHGAQNGKPIYASIWTTTPWTLPANLAICVGDNISYALVEDETAGTRFIVAAALIEALAATSSKKLKIIVDDIPGSALVGARAQHPLDSSRLSVILSGAHVTTESGTGLVHTAPGHGQDDFAVCKLHGIQPLCPVNDSGHFTAEAGPRFEGKFILKEGNDAVIQALSEVPNALFHSHKYTHKYPYDWRTKKPVIIRATRQWFADLRYISQGSVAALSNVNVVPRSGLKRLESMLGTRSDWCISRQRSWGVPIPVLYDDSTDEALLTEESIAHIQNLMSMHGSDCWWSMSAEELLAPEYRNDGKVYRKGNDTMDVWFDSGSSWAGVLKERGLPIPADVYLEGSDQHRGWFQSSLLTSVAVHGEAPYKTLVTHGFLLDEKLQKMSKSLGNVIEPAYVIEGGKDKQKAPAYGVDVMRLWVASTDYTDDVIVSDALMAATFNNLRKLRNTARFMLGVLTTLLLPWASLTTNSAPWIATCSTSSLPSYLASLKATRTSLTTLPFTKFNILSTLICPPFTSMSSRTVSTPLSLITLAAALPKLPFHTSWTLWRSSWLLSLFTPLRTSSNTFPGESLPQRLMPSTPSSARAGPSCKLIGRAMKSLNLGTQSSRFALMLIA